MPTRLSPWLVAIAGLLVLTTHAHALGIVGDQTEPQPMQYRIEGGPLRDLAARFQPGELAILEKLNRADIKHLSRLDRIVLPSEWRGEMDYSPFPAGYPAAAELPQPAWPGLSRVRPAGRARVARVRAVAVAGRAVDLQVGPELDARCGRAAARARHAGRDSRQLRLRGAPTVPCSSLSGNRHRAALREPVTGIRIAP